MRENFPLALNLIKIIYKMMKSAIGAVFHISQLNVEVILGLPSVDITNTVNGVKHYLKIIANQTEQQNDAMLQFIETLEKKKILSNL